MRLIDGDALIEKFNEKTDLAECLVDARTAERFATFCALADAVEEMPIVDAVPVAHGRWVLEAHKERANCRWNVTAECSECCDEIKEIWAGFFPNVPDCIARDASLISAEKVEISNYCPNCGAKMDLEEQNNA